MVPKVKRLCIAAWIDYTAFLWTHKGSFMLETPTLIESASFADEIADSKFYGFVDYFNMHAIGWNL